MKPEDVTDEMVSAMENTFGTGRVSWDFVGIDPKEIIAASVNAVGQQKLRLPRVELKDLVPGRWYMVIDIGGRQHCLRSFQGDGVVLLPGLHGWPEIYGPLPEFELEEK